MLRDWMNLLAAALMVVSVGCADDGNTPDDGGEVSDELVGDPNATVDGLNDLIADGESAHASLDGKSDGVLPGFEGALDVNAPVIVIAEDVPVPSYRRAQGANGFGLGGTEFWQKWSGGLNPTYSYSEGTDAGRKCMQASAIRFDALMADPPATYSYARENSNWSGRHFNWNDDFSAENSYGSASGARLWAWRTGLMKFISQTGQGGKCYLVTRAQVEAAGAVCALKAARADGETQGCAVRANEVDRVLERHADFIAEVNGPDEEEPVEPDPNAETYETTPGAEIPDADPTGIKEVITVEGEGTVSVVTVAVDIVHTYVGDLTVTLTHGDKTIVLHDATGGGEDDLNLEISTEDFAGMDKKGEWILRVADDAAQDTGSLKRFALSL